MVTLLLAFWGPPLPNEPSPSLVYLLLATSCLVLASLAAHAGTALLVYSPTKLARHCKQKSGETQGDRAGLIAHLQTCGRQYEFLAWGVALAAIVGCFFLLEAAAAGSIAWPFFTIGAFATLLGCAALPIGLSATQSERLVLLTLPGLRVLRGVAYYPIVVPFMGLTRGLLRALRVPDAARTPEEIADEIMAAVTDSAAENALEDEERHWIENIVELKEVRVSEAMTPRTDIVAFESDLDLREAVSRAIETGFSRYPVYEDTIDHVVGVFYAKDALGRLSNGASKQVAISEVMRKPLFVPESMGVVELLRRFKTSKLQMAVVLDEYGGIAGLISVEDILEEIIGDMADEFDADEEEAIKVITPDRVIEISGRARVPEVNEVLGAEIPDNPEYDTVAGYVFASLSTIPEEGETVEVDGIEFTILESDDRRIRRMRMTVPEPQVSEREP